ncbi:MAG: hypothetical protein JOZ33_07505 [Acidobacteriaceae bacterium]|nr:hypothetical protein [Acidobacteriaceae bacterium]
MSSRLTLLIGTLLASLQAVLAQSAAITVPDNLTAGSAFSIKSTGTGNAVLYIVGLGQVIRRDVGLGETVSFPPGTLYKAGRYLVILAGPSSNESAAFDVVPGDRPAAVSFLARPSRLPVGLHDGVTGAVYVFDAYQNLITKSTPVSFELSSASGSAQVRNVVTREGAAWAAMDSSRKEGAARFTARVNGISNTRVIDQVPGDPCGLKISARQAGQKLELQTDPVRDCSGNPVSDGTIVTFTETYGASQSTVDVPLKRGIARIEMPACNGARISVASGVVMGNEIRWGR